LELSIEIIHQDGKMNNTNEKQYRRGRMLRKTIGVLALAGAAMSAQAGVVLQENFNNVPGLTSSGWVLNNASTPSGITPGWFQGDQSQFAAQNGSAESYAAANYNNAAAGGTLDNWLITPVFSTAENFMITFWVRGMADPQYSDHFAFGLSAGGSALTDFTLGNVLTATTDDWTKYSISMSGLGAGATGRLAIQYTGVADFSNYIGVDDLTVAVPEPSTTLILGAGLLGLIAARRRKQS
jgi:hypothetical protein